MFVNNLESFYASMHSMGLFYTKESEGSTYYNGTETNAVGNAVPPGGCFTYKWYIIPPTHKTRVQVADLKSQASRTRLSP